MIFRNSSSSFGLAVYTPAAEDAKKILKLLREDNTFNVLSLPLIFTFRVPLAFVIIDYGN